MKKRILSILLVVCMVVTLLQTPALATSNPTTNLFDISEGHITITNGTTSGTVKVAYGSSQSKDNINGDTIIITGTTTSNKVIVNTSSHIMVKIRLDSLDIRLANDCAFDIQNTSVVDMTLVGINILKSGNKRESDTYYGYAGLQVENGSSVTAEVTIGGNGSLEATGGEHAAGIGGRAGWYINKFDYTDGANGASGGKINIKSGTVKATGSLNGAGIGGGGSTNGGVGGTINITGGEVTAIGGGNAAGIGGGDGGGAAGNIKISNTAKVVAASSGTKFAIEDDDVNITPVSGTVANVLMANYRSDIAASTNTEVKDASSNSLYPAVSFAPQRAYKSIAFTMPTASYTLHTGAAKQMGTISGTTSTTFTVAAGLNVFTDVTASTYTAKVTVKKDDSTWTADTPTIKMSTSSSTLMGAVSGALISGEYTFNGLADGNTYYAWEDGTTDTYTGRSVTIDSKTATVNYYSLTLSAGTGTSSPTGIGSYLAGKNVPIDVTVNTGYQWSKWTSSNTAKLSDQTAKSVGITMPAAPIALTATATPIQYDITYTLNGGTVSVVNPGNYNVENDAIVLNNPARPGYYFLGWTGSNGEAVQTSVSIPKGSTENKNYTANWKADKPASAPATSIVTAKTDTSLTITTQDGYEYSVDNGSNWKSGTGSYTFTSLAPNTTYNLVYRKAAVSTGDISAASDASEALSVKTKTEATTAPGAPSIGTGEYKPTSDSIAISTVAGNEYYISTSTTADWSGTPNGYYKATDSGIYTFDNLNTETKYYIHFRKAETADAMPSSSSYVEQYTLPSAPSAGAVTINYASETISFDNTYELSSNVDFDPTIASSGTVMPGTTYYVRVKSASGVPASEAISFTIPPRPAAPTTITAIKTKDGITITSVSGQEYKIGDGAWQDGGSFAGLSPNTDYTVFARVKAVSSGSPSFASEEFSATIKTKSDGNSGFTMPTISVSPTYSPGKTLNEIPLPLGWAWVAPTTIPAVAITSYSAVYTPSDTETVDYSDVTGYEVDGSGKVTINRLIPLTVNRAIPTAADFDFIQPASLDYSGTIKTAAVTAKTGISGMGTVTVVYNPGETTASPVNAGTYTVKIDIAQGDNYGAATGVADEAWKFSIAKVTQAALNVTNIPAIVTYGDSFTLGTTGGSGTGEVTWAVTEGESATVDASGNVTTTGIGTTTLTATKSADGNHLADVAATYTFTPVTLPLIVDDPLATGGWTKTYDGNTDFDPSRITVGAITNKVGSDDVTVSVQSATYDTADIGSGNKKLAITYAIGGENKVTYSVPNDTVVENASITAATPTITLVNKTAVYSDKIIGIDEATVTGVPGGTTPGGIIAYTYYTKETCADADKTTVDKNGAEAIGGAPKSAGTYYVKAMIAASGNYSAATSGAVTLTIYYPSSGQSASTPVIVDGKAVDMGTAEVKDGTTTIKVDQDKMREQLKSAKDSVVIPINANTDTAAAQLVVQNVESMAERRMTLTIKVNDISYEIPTGSVATAAILRNLGAADSSKVPLNVTISKLSQNSVSVKDGTLVMVPVSFTITATYNGKTVEVDKFESYVHRVIEISSGVDPKSITTAVVVEKNGAQRHVPTEVYTKGGKWYAKINSLTNSTYALIQSNASFDDTKGKWYAAVASEMASRKILSGVGENKFAGDRSITRAEFAAILVRALGLPADGKSIFVDVSPSAWYSGAVATAAEYGLVTGKGDNKFAPGAYITRQEAMTMLQRAAKLADYSGSDGSLGNFADAGSVSKWAQNAAKWNVGSGLIVGSGGLIRPGDNITRAESGAVILRLLQKAGLVDVRS